MYSLLFGNEMILYLFLEKSKKDNYCDSELILNIYATSPGKRLRSFNSSSVLPYQKIR